MIKRYSLVSYQSRIYYNKKNLTLSITGVGQQMLSHTVQKVKYYFQPNTKKYDVWLNIGTAGHPHEKIGELLFANKVYGTKQSKCWYPQLPFKTSIKTAPLKTVLDGNQDYTPNTMQDMEAAGFFSVTHNYSLCEFIHALKIISDNKHTSIKMMSAKLINDLIMAKLDDIQHVIKQFQSLSEQQISLEKPPENYQVCLDTWHFTQYQKGLLWKMLRRYQLLLPGHDLIGRISDLPDGKNVLKALKKYLHEQPFVLN